MLRRKGEYNIQPFNQRFPTIHVQQIKGSVIHPTREGKLSVASTYNYLFSLNEINKDSLCDYLMRSF